MADERLQDLYVQLQCWQC